MRTFTVSERALWRPLSEDSPRTTALVSWWTQSTRVLEPIPDLHRSHIRCHVNEWVDFVAWANGIELGHESDSARARKIDPEVETLVLAADDQLYAAYRLHVFEQPISDSLQDQKLAAVSFFYSSNGIRRLIDDNLKKIRDLQLPPCSLTVLLGTATRRMRHPLFPSPLIEDYLAARGLSVDESKRTLKFLNCFCRWYLRRRAIAFALLDPSRAELANLDHNILSITGEELLAYARWLTGPRLTMSVAAAQRRFVELNRLLDYLERSREIDPSIREPALPGSLRELHLCDFDPRRFVGRKPSPSSLVPPLALFPLAPIERVVSSSSDDEKAQAQLRAELWRYGKWLAAEGGLTIRRHSPLALRAFLEELITSATLDVLRKYRAEVIANPAKLISHTRYRFAAVRRMYSPLHNVKAVPLIASRELRSPTKQREHTKQLKRRVRPPLKILTGFECKDVSPLWDFLWWWAAHEQIELLDPVPLNVERDFERSLARVAREVMLSYREKLRAITVPGIIPLQQLKLRLAIRFVEWLAANRKIPAFSGADIPILCKDDFVISPRE